MVLAFHWRRFVKGPPGSRQHPFGHRHESLLCGQLYAQPPSGGTVHARAFLLPFGRRHLLLEPSCSRHGVPRCCLPAGGRSCRTMTGFPRFTHPSCVRCRVPPLPRGRGALLTVLPKTASTAASQRPAHIPQKTLPSPGLLITRLPSGVHVVHPSGLPLTCNQRTDHRPLGFLPELHTQCRLA